MSYLARSIYVLIAMTVLLACTGCAEIVYGTLQQGQSMTCHEMQSTADRDECWKRSDMSYDEYQHELDRQKQER